MFAQRLNKAISTVGASASDIARAVGCDRSNISRMCSGVRVPKKGASSSRRVVGSICSFAEENGGISALCALVGCEERVPASRLRGALTDWLYDGVNTVVHKPPRRQKKAAPYARMGARLNAIMELAELSNVRFGQLLNLDASYISRFRNGLRSPASNRRIMDDICAVLLKRLVEQERLSEFAALINSPRGVPKSEEEAFFLLRDWLFEIDRESDAPAVEKLLEKIDSFMPRMPKAQIPAAVADRAALMNGERIYYGTDGFRSAVLRFVSGLAQRGASELFLYSDQNLEWMEADSEFSAQLKSLLFACMRNGVKINIIHTIDRTTSEMLKAISSWLPLYMTGRITSYYFRKKSQSRFSYTLFLCPGYACVEGGGFVGDEDRHGIYRFDTDAESLEAHRAVFDAMLANAKTLVNIYESDNAERLSAIGGGAMSVIGTCLPVSTLTEEAVKSIISRAGVSSAERSRVMTLWKARRSVMLRNVSGGYIELYGVLADKERVAAGKVAIDLPGVSINYTPEEYAAQVRGVLSLMDTYPNFRFFIMPQTPFENVQISVAESSVAVSRLTAPRISFLISHPLIREAFSSYISGVKENCVKDEAEVRARLKDYL